MGETNVSFHDSFCVNLNLMLHTLWLFGFQICTALNSLTFINSIHIYYGSIKWIGVPVTSFLIKW